MSERNPPQGLLIVGNSNSTLSSWEESRTAEGLFCYFSGNFPRRLIIYAEKNVVEFVIIREKILFFSFESFL